MTPNRKAFPVFQYILTTLINLISADNFPDISVSSVGTTSSVASNLLPQSTSQTTYDPASRQLLTWAAEHSQSSTGTVRNDQGCPVPSLTASLGIEPYGPLLLQDIFLINKLAQFNRERIPERVVHTKGHGAFGYFRVTHDISSLTKADFLNGINKITPVFARFSTVAGESGTADTIRDSLGFAVKFYTVDGIHDFAGNPRGVFPIRDPFLFPDLNKSRKRNPQTHVPDFTAFWDFSSLRPEVILHTLMMFSDFGANSRVFDGHSVHAFKFVNKEGVPSFVKLHFISQQPFKWFNATELEIVAGMDPDYATRDLYDAIANHNYPKWQLNIQVMTLEQAQNYPVNPFDSTKVWRLEEFPMRPVGELVLNRNPVDYFNDVEQAAFDPGRMVPGIEPSLDRLLHGRTFAYADAQRYRLGVNFAQLEVNRPKFPLRNYDRDGVMRENPNGEGGPNYFPNSFHGPLVNGSVMESRFHVDGIVDRFDRENDTEDNFRLARLYLYKDLSKGQRDRVAENLGGFLAKAVKEVRERAVRNLFYKVSKEFGDQVWGEMEKAVDKMKGKIK